jgi:hypothetical protein
MKSGFNTVTGVAQANEAIAPPEIAVTAAASKALLMVFITVLLKKTLPKVQRARCSMPYFLGQLESTGLKTRKKTYQTLESING